MRVGCVFKKQAGRVGAHVEQLRACVECIAEQAVVSICECCLNHASWCVVCTGQYICETFGGGIVLQFGMLGVPSQDEMIFPILFGEMR